MKFIAALAIAAATATASDWNPLYPDYNIGYDNYVAPKEEHPTQPTYGYLGKEAPYYGVYRGPRKVKTLIANDGYRVKQRDDPYNRLYKTVNAKCIMEDPEEESKVRGVIYLSQGATDAESNVWGEIWGLGYGQKAELTINALGDLTEGCESAGAVFNPFVSRSGYGPGKTSIPAPGLLDVTSDGDSLVIEKDVDVDLSGTHSIIGRSMVLTAMGYDYYGNPTEEVRVACCTIGLSSGKKSAPAPQYYGSPEPYYPEPRGYKKSYAPSGYDYAW